MNDTPQDKYLTALAECNAQPSDVDVQTQVAVLVDKKIPENNTEGAKEFLFNCTNLITLNTTDSGESVIRFTKKVNQFDNGFPDLKNATAIYIYPNFTQVVKDTLEVGGVNIACISGEFPSSQTFTEIEVTGTVMATADRADEIDIVIPAGAFLNGDYKTACEEIMELRETCKGHHSKVILKVGTLKTTSNVEKASILSMYFGADFIKTSTRKQQSATTPEAVYAMCQTIKECHEQTENKVGFKLASGINSVSGALIYYTITKEMLGEGWLSNKLFRLGTSRLVNLLSSEIKGEELRSF